MEPKNTYRKPTVITYSIYYEDTLTASSSASISGGNDSENFQPEITDWIGSDLNTPDSYKKGDI